MKRLRVVYNPQLKLFIFESQADLKIVEKKLGEKFNNNQVPIKLLLKSKTA